jgi:sortase A
MKPWSWADAWPVAKLNVPRLGVKLLLLADMGTCGPAPGHPAGAAGPGARRAHLVLSASGGAHFHFLQALRPGDEIRLETPGGEERRYRVRQQFVADRRAVPLHLDPFAQRLTLMSPYPSQTPEPGGALRYVVSCERHEALTAAQGEAEGCRAIG